jgi:hypothetical protein
MKWTIFSVVCAALISSMGCCHQRACSPCGGYAGYSNYGATYAPMPSTCPGGNCGPYYPSGAMVPTTQQAYTPYTTTASLDYLPAF